MEKPPTLVCVHAHPDDEALFTAGITSHYAVARLPVVLVTCTNGALGLRPGWSSRVGSTARRETTVATRAGELQRAARCAGFSRLVTWVTRTRA